MRLNRNLGMLLLAVYLILVGLVALIPSLGILGTLAPFVALIAGVLLLINR